MRAVVELFRTVGREKELHREIVAFSISYNENFVNIYGHYVEIDDLKWRCYRHPVREINLDLEDGKV